MQARGIARDIEPPHQEGRAALGRRGARHQRFASARRPKQQHALTGAAVAGAVGNEVSGVLCMVPP